MTEFAIYKDMNKGCLAFFKAYFQILYRFRRLQSVA